MDKRKIPFPPDTFGEPGIFGAPFGDVISRDNINDIVASYVPAIWWDATRGLFTTAAGSTPANADGDPVGRWEDQSGNGRNLTQVTVSAPDRRPILKLDIYNHRPTIRFDGIDDAIISAFDASNGLPTPTVYLVCTRTTGVARIVGEGSWRGCMYTISNTVFGLGEGGDPDANSFRYTITDPGVGLHVFINRGKQALIVDGTTYTVKSNLTDGYVNNVIHVGARNQTDSFFPGDICEIVIFSSIHDAATAAIIQAALKVKWGTP